MCGRFSLGLQHAEIEQLHGYNVHVAQWVDQAQFVPRHNIAPRSQAPVLRRQDQSETGASADPILHTMKWGLVPHWSKHEDTSLSTINARAENLTDGGGMWASIKGRKRCAVLCEGYYEWLKKGKERIPYFTKHQSGSLMLLAGLYDCAVLEGHEQPLWTFTIVTTAASNGFAWLHDRQPVILSSSDALDAWLDTSSHAWTPALSKLVAPHDDASAPLVCYQVPKEVGKVGAESPTFIQPIAERKDGIQAMFAKQTQARSDRGEPPKRKREPSREEPQAGSQSKKMKKDIGDDSDDDVVEVVDAPPEGSKSPLRTPTKADVDKPRVSQSQSSPRKAAKPKSPAKQSKETGSAKITQFFGKS